MDFTLTTYCDLINALNNQGFSFLTFEEFLKNPASKSIILRNDVDTSPHNSLCFARIQANKGIKGTYYFRNVPESFDEMIIKEIYALGHEIGYHYEDFSFVAKRRLIPGNMQHEKRKGYRAHGVQLREKELAKIAIDSFKVNLERMRQIIPVKTICMHGSPMSSWDSRLLWKYYDYKDFGIIGEPYFDINFEEVLYLTDTGRCWDGDLFNLRDKFIQLKDRKDAATDGKSAFTSAPNTPRPATFPKFHSTFNIIKAAEEDELPDKIMMTFHPQRWTDKLVPWTKELVWQNIKNMGKYIIVKMGD